MDIVGVVLGRELNILTLTMLIDVKLIWSMVVLFLWKRETIKGRPMKMREDQKSEA